MIKDYNHNLHKYIAMRVLRSLASDMFLPEILSPEKAAELAEFLIRWTLYDETRWMEQMRKPAETWQVGVMTNRLLVRPLHISQSSLLISYLHIVSGHSWHGCSIRPEVVRPDPRVCYVLRVRCPFSLPSSLPPILSGRPKSASRDRGSST